MLLIERTNIWIIIKLKLKQSIDVSVAPKIFMVPYYWPPAGNPNQRAEQSTVLTNSFDEQFEFLWVICCADEEIISVLWSYSGESEKRAMSIK